MPETLHASCIAINGKGVLLFGHSGSGKSDLALRLIDQGAQLVGDDQVTLTEENDTLIVSPCERIRSLIEARHLGIMHIPFIENIPLALAVNLSANETPERMPNPSFWSCLGVRVPLLSLGAFHASTPAKIRLFLQYPKENLS